MTVVCGLLLSVLVSIAIWCMVPDEASANEDVEFVCVMNITDICTMPKPATDIKFMSDSTYVITAGTYKACWNVIDGTYESIGLEHSQAIALDSMNGRLASAVPDANVRIYNLTVSPYKQEGVVRDSNDTLESTKGVVFGHDSSTVFTISDKELFKWAYDGYRWRLVGKQVLIEPSVEKSLWAVFYDRGRDLLVTMSSHGDCYIHDTALSLISRWNISQYRRPDPEFHPPYYTSYCLLENWTVVWYDRDHQFIFLDLSTGEYAVIPMTGGLGHAHHICQSHDGQWLAVVDFSEVNIYNSSTLEREDWFLCSGYLTGIDWSMDDRYIATTDDAENLQIWVDIRHAGFNHPPGVSILSHADGETVANTVRVVGNATDDDQVVSVLFKLDDGEWQFANGSTEWDFLWDTRLITNGLHRVSVRAFDGEKFSPIAQVALYVDNDESTRVLPTVTIDEPSDGSVVSGTIFVRGRAWGPNPVRSVRVSYSSDDFVLYVVESNWSLPIDTTAIPNGTLEVEVVAYDGLWYSEPCVVRLTVQNEVPVLNRPPSLTIHHPVEGETCSGKYECSGLANDEESKLGFVLVKVDEGEWQMGFNGIDGLQEWVFLMDTWELENGIHRFSAMCCDDIQLSDVASVSFVVDNDREHPYGRPNVRVTAPANGSMVAGLVEIKGVADSEPLIRCIEYTVSGQDPLTAEGSGNWSFVLDTMVRPNGICEIRIWARGYQMDSRPAILVLDIMNDRPPTCRITWPVPNQTLLEDIDVRGTAMDPEDGELAVEVQIDDGEWQQCLGGSEWTFRWDVQDLTGGPHIVRARAFDGTNYSDTSDVVVSIYHPEEPTQPTSRDGNRLWLGVLITLFIAMVMSVSFVNRHRFFSRGEGDTGKTM